MEAKTVRALERVRAQLEDLDRARAPLAARRDHLVRVMLEAGASLREAGTASGLSHGAVAKIRDRDVS